jgi:heme exporter protein B
VSTGPSTLGAAWAIARKDLVIEFRTRTAFVSAAMFAVIGLATSYFVWDRTAVRPVDMAPGALWVIFIFSGLLGVQRSFALEQADRAIDALLLAPLARESVYLGKALSNAIFVGGVQAIAIPVCFLFYNLPVDDMMPLIPVAALATVGLASVGTLLGAMAVNTRMGELLLPLISLPFFLPIVAPAAIATTRALAGEPFSYLIAPIELLAGFDVVFFTACALAYPYTIEE